MAETSADELEKPKKSGLMPIVLGLALAILGGGGGYFAVSSGMLFGAQESAETKDGSMDAAEKTAKPQPLGDVSFVPLPQILVTLGPGAGSGHLRLLAQLEVPGQYESDVTHILPRVVDVLNDYLGALRPADIEAPGALIKLRAQMLRRVQIVTGEGRVNDLLVMEFILN